MNQRRSVSLESKKHLTNSTFRTTQLSTPKQDLNTYKPFSPSKEAKLQLFRKIFHVKPTKTSTVMNFYDVDTVTPVVCQSAQLDKYDFPNWLKGRTDFTKLRKSKYFDYHLKVFSICEQDPFKRSEELKEVVANYLAKLDFFRLMPMQMLKQISGRLFAKSYEENEIICNKGDKGDCMFVIFDGFVEVIGKNKKLGPKNIIGRNALDNDQPRNATLKSIGSSHLLILNRIDYVTILNNIMKSESVKQEQFIRSLQLFAHFSEEKLKKFCNALQGKYLTPNENLYSAGDLVDHLYIVKHGILAKTVVMDLEDQNRWPINQKKWMSQTITRTLSFNIEYKAGSLVGYYDILDSEFDSDRKRNETIDAKTDCFLLFISKSQFFHVFQQTDLQYFHNYHVQNNPLTFEQLVKSTRQKESEQKQKVQIVTDAIYSHLRQYSFDYNTLKIKEKKYDQVKQNQVNASKEFNSQYKIIRRDKHLKILTSQYE
ncbi:unnamed protein product (macronuclear) [Paramecium tetraurelia]|uniref:Cyclic nucleotide-binding domain-containing protein n=1 Tax=Paramecium tetraurelia TaxID=5888 RepID=A0D0L5_PARTE|nr:uncharacterized protein GSPATT00012134001 [Paramecium tetraurelia]CAK76582.1 unnamed protein product [Paramecium tetraurelia]|eukprot:XP_001443979.1 hypothetical protein (macronuclear) [Paramecium tetraurelia strain d4-2]